MADPQGPPSGFSDSDQQWYDRLTGRPVGNSGARAVQEADALRLAIEAERERAVASLGPEGLEQQRKRLHERARREGLWGSHERPSRLRWPILVPAAMALVLAVVAAPRLYDFMGPGYDAPPALRGESSVFQRRTEEPRRAAEAFAQALRQAGLKAGVYHQRPAYVVDVQLDAGDLPLAAPAFRAQGLAPARGYNRVMFTSAGIAAP